MFKTYSSALLSFSSILTAGVNWDGTEKVMENQSCHTVFLTDDVIQNPLPFENNNVHSPKKL